MFVFVFVCVCVSLSLINFKFVALLVGEFVVNIMSDWFLESANHTSGAFPPSVSEIDLCALSLLPSLSLSVPRVQESAIHLECTVQSIIPLINEDKVHSSSIVLGRIQRVHVLKEILIERETERDGERKKQRPVVDWRKLRPVGRLGGDSYTMVTNEREMKRPKV